MLPMLLVLLYPMQGLGNITNDDIQCASYVDNRIYVNYLANGANNGTSWADAFTNLQAALTAANTVPAAEIWERKVFTIRTKEAALLIMTAMLLLQ